MRPWIEWDNDKARENLHKHGISFEDAIEVFYDPYHIEYYDEAHSTLEEQRYRIIGKVRNELVILAVYTPRGEKYRLISARKASGYERRRYYNERRRME